MPRRNDIKSILLIGSGPIVIGQACEFDYSGTQAIRALRSEGYKVILVNSNPATIMTDPDLADRTYIEPITAEFVEQVIAKERPCAVLPTMGGQTALNIALELDSRGIFEKYSCKLIGASIDAIRTAEDRDLFKRAMLEIGLDSAQSGIVHSVKEAHQLGSDLGYPLVLRPSRTLGGTGGAIVRDESELASKVSRALAMSPNKEVLVEQSLLGWKEIELEVMRDHKDNAVIVCGIENLDPMGVHTGDSITVAPIQTLTDKEYQRLRDASLAVLRRVGVETGGSNVQFAINPENGNVIVIEMNPRVSRSSALASKATGFPIAKIAAKLAVGYTLDEIQNDITGETPACFEPSIDYVVVKIPRFNFEKFPLAQDELGTQMKSVGEVLSFGRNFSEALQKAICSLELDSYGFDAEKSVAELGKHEILNLCRTPSSRRLWYVGEAFRVGCSFNEIHNATDIDPWFLTEIENVIRVEEQLKVEYQSSKVSASNPSILSWSKERWLTLKQLGFSDSRIARLLNISIDDVCSDRHRAGVNPQFSLVDTCSAEFAARTPYLYSTYERDVQNTKRGSVKISNENPPVIILGSGPNRIGQGIEFDYCCVHAVMAIRELGIEAVMVNCNPETVSTDYDVSDRLYFEPLTVESVLNIVERENARGVIVQFGGQTPLKLSNMLAERGVKILGTDVHSIDAAEDRESFSSLVKKLQLSQPEYAIARSIPEALKAAPEVGFPLMIRPSFVLGGRAMRIIYNEDDLSAYLHEGVRASHDRPVLLDRYLHNAIEVDVDAVSDGTDVIIAGVMQHIEPAGVHSGDSSCCLPPHSLSPKVILELEEKAKALTKALKVVGLMNVQFAVVNGSEIFVLEANPRASRTVPFVSKATGIPWAKVATKTMLGVSLVTQGLKEDERYYATPFFSVKACVFPFSRFPGTDTLLGPEMKSTGEVMGIHTSFSGGFAKSQLAALVNLPRNGTALLSVPDRDKQALVPIAQKLRECGYSLMATEGTATFLSLKKIEVKTVKKVRDGGPHVIELIGSGAIGLIINIPEGNDPLLDARSIRLIANELNVPNYTSIAAAAAAVEAIGHFGTGGITGVKALQDYHKDLGTTQ